MLKWAGIIAALTLIVGVLVVMGVIEVAAGLIELGFFLALGLIALLVIGGFWLKKKVD